MLIADCWRFRKKSRFPLEDKSVLLEIRRKSLQFYITSMSRRSRWSMAIDLAVLDADDSGQLDRFDRLAGLNCG